MTKDKRKNNNFNENNNVIDSRCLDFCHQEITYATQRLVAELSIAKRLADHCGMTNGGR